MSTSTGEKANERNYSYLSEGGDNCKLIREYFQKKIRVQLADGRVFVGRLDSLDSSMDVILYEATETFHINDEEKIFSRSAGRVVLPGRFIVKCEVEV